MLGSVLLFILYLGTVWGVYLITLHAFQTGRKLRHLAGILVGYFVASVFLTSVAALFLDSEDETITKIAFATTLLVTLKTVWLAQKNATRASTQNN